ncbi:accessory Sec system protein Asp1 [Limosilactobacillus caecicola]|uniref:accessory Sec system protein Asp1 n=1 Tax=Limosilactobacillus caecicola TaxID=2941332 RepID=UPI0020422EF7|nr:accessory Sec system protein Asp1 [Limosilactobacillus caecicola]
MNYLVPAWHDLQIDWSYSTPHLRFDDAASHVRTLQDGGEKTGVLITDYQPQITTKLSQMSLMPDDYFAVFDYLQGIEGLDGQVVDYMDFPWPEDAYFDFTNFRIFVIVDDKPYAQVTFDVQGKMLSINYLAGPDQNTQLLFDSRGFISRQESPDEMTYFSSAGVWRFKVSKQDGRVTINAAVNDFCQHNQYANLQSLIDEVINQHFLTTLHQDDRLIVTLDDEAKYSLTDFTDQEPIYSASNWHPYINAIQQVRTGIILTDTKRTAQTVQQQVPDDCRIQVLPLFQSQFKLGHSQRVSEQRVAIFAEHMERADLRQTMELIYPRLLDHPTDEGMYIFTYSPDKAGMVNEVFQQFRKDHDGEFILSPNEIDPGENKIDEADIPPLLTIKQTRLVSNMQVLTFLDKIRLLIMWGQPDPFTTIAAVSVGIPILQNFTSEEVQDHQNGIICQNFDELRDGIAYYLDTLKHWNESLVYNVQVLNQYSEDNIREQWERILTNEV